MQIDKICNSVLSLTLLLNCKEAAQLIAHRLKSALSIIIIVFLFVLNPCFASADSPAYRAVFSVKMIDAENTIPDNTSPIPLHSIRKNLPSQTKWSAG